jgi:hypothetical protein
LWLTHFGLVENIEAFLDSAAERLTAEADFVRTLIESSTDTDLPERITTYRAWHTALALEQDVDRALLDAHCPDLHFEANLVGVGRWIDKHGSRSA